MASGRPHVEGRDILLRNFLKERVAIATMGEYHYLRRECAKLGLAIKQKRLRTTDRVPYYEVSMRSADPTPSDIVEQCRVEHRKAQDAVTTIFREIYGIRAPDMITIQDKSSLPEPCQEAWNQLKITQKQLANARSELERITKSSREKS